MITKFARLEFELFTKPSKSDFLRVHQIKILCKIELFHNHSCLSTSERISKDLSLEIKKEQGAFSSVFEY
jgi:hypothetical protein